MKMDSTANKLQQSMETFIQKMPKCTSNSQPDKNNASILSHKSTGENSAGSKRSAPSDIEGKAEDNHEIK